MRLERDSFSEEFWKKSDWFHKLFNEAVKKAQEENRQKGVPNVYSYRGKFFYELPNGDIVTELPEEYKHEL
jgi:hypothetical protein